MDIAQFFFFWVHKSESSFKNLFICIILGNIIGRVF